MVRCRRLVLEPESYAADRGMKRKGADFGEIKLCVFETGQGRIFSNLFLPEQDIELGLGSVSNKENGADYRIRSGVKCPVHFGPPLNGKRAALCVFLKLVVSSIDRLNVQAQFRSCKLA